LVRSIRRLNANLSNLHPHNHLCVTASASSLTIAFPFNTIQLTVSTN